MRGNKHLATAEWESALTLAGHTNSTQDGDAINAGSEWHMAEMESTHDAKLCCEKDSQHAI